MRVDTVLRTVMVGGLLLGGSTAAFAAKWWNPLTWFEGSEKAKAEKTRYATERKDYVQTLEEAKATGDPKTIKQARAELRNFDKAHAKRMREIRKETHEQLRREHAAEHRAKAKDEERKAAKIERKAAKAEEKAARKDEFKAKPDDFDRDEDMEPRHDRGHGVQGHGGGAKGKGK